MLFAIFRCVDVGVPTSVDFVRSEPHQMVVAYTSANTYILDLETAKQVIMLDSKQLDGMYMANIPDRSVMLI